MWEHGPEAVTALKPENVIWDRAKKTANVVEVTVSNNFGLNRAERLKLLKYQDLINDLRKTWELEDISIIPVVVGSTGLVKTNMKNHLKDTLGLYHVTKSNSLC